jgi:hypothetical protein
MTLKPNWHVSYREMTLEINLPTVPDVNHDHLDIPAVVYDAEFNRCADDEPDPLGSDVDLAGAGPRGEEEVGSYLAHRVKIIH